MKPGWNVSLKKWMLLALAFCLLLPQAALAEDGAAVPRWNFIDLGDSHWATKHVRKIGLLGITSGDDQGRYNPTQNITREQAVKMAIYLMGLQREADANTVQVNLGFAVSPWAEKYVKYAVVKGLIDLREESANAAAGTGEWGTDPASREWIAKLLVKALGKGAEAAERDGEYTGFADDAAISGGYAGYVIVAKELGIMMGDNNRFNPTMPITRAEMAVVLGKTVQMLAAGDPRVVTGTLDAVTPGAITVRTQTGLVTYPLAAGAVFYTHEHNNPILPSTLTRGDAVLVIQHGGTAYFVEKTAQTVRYETITGEYANIYRDPANDRLMRIAVYVDGELRSYPFDPAVTSFTREDGTGLSTSELTAGSMLELTRMAGEEQITSVVVKKFVQERTIQGTVERLFPQERLLEIKDAATGERLPLIAVPTGADIWSGSRQLSLSDLHVGDEVRLKLVDETVKTIEVVQSSVTIVEGKVQKVDTGLRVVYLQGTPIIGYELDRNATISIAGLSTPKLADIQTDDSVLLELNADQRITKIVVQNRSIDARMGLEFVMFLEDSNTLIFQDRDKEQPEMRQLTADTVIQHQYQTVTIGQINQLFKKGDKIDLILTGDRLLRMSYSKTYTGVVKAISTRTNTITLDADDFGEVTFAYSGTPIVLMFGKSSANLGDLLIGDRVKLELDANQSRVQFISIEQQQMFKVKDKLSYKLVVTDVAGQSHDVHSPTSATFSHYDKLLATYADVNKGDYVMITFVGTQATEIHIPRVSYGIVQSVDASGGKFTFAEYGKNPRVIDPVRRLEVGGKTYFSAFALKAGDRILLAEGTDGLYFAEHLEKQQRRVVRYMANSKTLQFTVTNLQETNAFVIDDTVYLHQGGTPIAPSSLQANDMVDVYFHNGRLLEIEKR